MVFIVEEVFGLTHPLTSSSRRFFQLFREKAEFQESNSRIIATEGLSQLSGETKAVNISRLCSLIQIGVISLVVDW